MEEPDDSLLAAFPTPAKLLADYRAQIAMAGPDLYRRALLEQPPADSEEHEAYDGSNYKPLRELTARERDILCRIIGDVINDIRTTGGDKVGRAVRLYYGDAMRLMVMRDVLDPRRDVPALDGIELDDEGMPVVH